MKWGGMNSRESALVKERNCTPTGCCLFSFPILTFFSAYFSTFKETRETAAIAPLLEVNPLQVGIERDHFGVPSPLFLPSHLPLSSPSLHSLLILLRCPFPPLPLLPFLFLPLPLSPPTLCPPSSIPPHIH